MAKLFFSYAHQDEAIRDELEIHLTSLKHQGVIELWHDRRVIVGDEILNEIDKKLDQADIILLLVSPHFIASKYCYDIEMRRAMERHERGEARVVPVILEPCDWQRLPFGKLLVTPTDGKPVSKFPNRNDAFLQITKAIRQAAGELKPSDTSEADSLLSSQSQTVGPGAQIVAGKPRSSNLRIKKTFSDYEKDNFLAEAFEYIGNFFEESLTELERRNPEIMTNFRRTDANHFTSVIYVNGSEVNRCTIWLGDHRQVFPGGIAFSIGNFRGNNSVNASLSIKDDGHIMFLSPSGYSIMQNPSQEGKMTFEGGAEYFWAQFIAPLQ